MKVRERYLRLKVRRLRLSEWFSRWSAQVDRVAYQGPWLKVFTDEEFEELFDQAKRWDLYKPSRKKIFFIGKD